MRLSREQLARITLGRQFPGIRGRGRAALLALFDRVGPVQSQAARAPFLTAASRLPGISAATIRAGFAEHGLLKATNLRGTVHTCRPDLFGAADTLSRRARAGDQTRVLGLRESETDLTRLIAEIEDFCRAEWRPRSELVEHVLDWLAEHRAGPRAGQNRTQVANLIWVHSGLLRRPPDDHWERRTDALHRTATAVIGPQAAPMSPHQAMIMMVRAHLSAYGPATKQDIAWWSGVGPRVVDVALSTMADDLVHHTGPDGEDLLDLVAAADRRQIDPGLRLLPEFDGLVLGYAPSGRRRFLDPDHLSRVWRRSNGMFAAMVLVEGRIGGVWRTAPGRPAGDTVIEVERFVGAPVIQADDLVAPVQDVARALDLTVTDVRLRSG